VVLNVAHIVTNSPNPGLAAAYINAMMDSAVQTKLAGPPACQFPTNAKVPYQGEIKNYVNSQDELLTMITTDWAKINPAAIPDHLSVQPRCAQVRGRRLIIIPRCCFCKICKSWRPGGAREAAGGLALALTIPLILQMTADEVIEYDAFCCAAYVSFWHKANMRRMCPFLSALRVKRTSQAYFELENVGTQFLSLRH
jgi:hypothetical protein